MSQSPYDRHLDDFGRALSAVAPEPRPARRRLRFALATGALAAAGIAAAVVLSPAGGRLDVVAEARAALGTPGDILNYSVQFEGGMVPKDPAKARSAADRARHARATQCRSGPPEVWQTTSGETRWRANWPAAPCAIMLSAGHAFSGRSETAYAPGALVTYDPEGNWLQTETDPPASASAPPQFYDDGLIGRSHERDPASQIRSLLTAGRLHDAGEVTVDGRRLRRFVAKLPAPGTRGANPPGPPTIEYQVDATTFAPVTLSRTFRQRTRVLGTATHTPHQVRTFRYTATFLRYRHLPLTPANERLLEVHPPADVERTTLDGSKIRGFVSSLRHPNAAQRRQFREATRRHERLYPRKRP